MHSHVISEYNPYGHAIPGHIYIDNTKLDELEKRIVALELDELEKRIAVLEAALKFGLTEKE